MKTDRTLPVRAGIVRFTPEGGGLNEEHLTLRVLDASLSFREQANAVLEAYTRQTAGRKVLFRRFFLSDPANQAGVLRDALSGLPRCATSVVGQPPLDGTRIAAWVYSVPGEGPSDEGFRHNGFTHVWTGGMRAPGADSEAQTASLFEAYGAFLAGKGLATADDCLRTWLFVRDVDLHYGGVVKGRRGHFTNIGLTPATHFIASTGICGTADDPHSLVTMDTYAVGGLCEGQVRYLYAGDHLSPTALYGVTFERGTAVTYGDRTHVLISGTASIDKDGRVVHEGDVSRQTERMLENVGALLAEAGAGFGDVACSIVYLRDYADYGLVRDVLSRVQPSLNPLYVLAPVCRPAWLVEMECLAIARKGDASFHAF